MKLNRLFHDASVNFRRISIKTWVVGILLGLASALAIYAFAYTIREVFRVMSFSFARIPEILSDHDRWWSNLLFASLSLVFGNGIMVNFLLGKPQIVFSRRNLKRSRILTDQIFLSFNFAHWALRMGFMVGASLMSFLTFEQVSVLLKVSLLLPLVFFLDSWKTISQVLGRKGYKWMGAHFLLLVMLSLLLCKWEVINYNKIDQQMLYLNPIVELPQSFYFEEDCFIDGSLELKFKIVYDENGEVIIQNTMGTRFTLEEVTAEVLVFKSSTRSELIPFTSVTISADKHIDLHYIKSLEAQVIWAGIHKFNYELGDDNYQYQRFDRKFIRKRSYKEMEGIKFSPNQTPFPPLFDDSSLQYTDTLQVYLSKTQYLFKNTPVQREKLVATLKPFINSETLIQYKCEKDVSYQNYIDVLSAHYKAAFQLREQKQTVFKQHRYDKSNAYKEEQEKLRTIYPLLIDEFFITSDNK